MLYDPNTNINLSQNCVNIFIRHVPSQYMQPHTYFINMEQLSLPGWMNLINDKISHNVNIMDYSQMNIDIIKHYHNTTNITHIPYQYNEHEILKLKSMLTQKKHSM